MTGTDRQRRCVDALGGPGWTLGDAAVKSSALTALLAYPVALLARSGTRFAPQYSTARKQPGPASPATQTPRPSTEWQAF